MRPVSIAFIAILCAALASPVSADNDKNKGKGHGGGPKADKHDNVTVVPSQQIVIVDRDRTLVRTYYRNEYVAGRCPPGLAKKNNGCMPPGQAKKVWIIGQPLPPDVVYYPMPRELWTQLTPPPYGYEYVRVDDDIVLVSTTTRVIAALLGDLADLGDFND